MGGVILASSHKNYAKKTICANTLMSLSFHREDMLY